MKILVTGGCGFIGSNFIDFLLNSRNVPEDISVLNVDKKTYAGQGNNLELLCLDKDPRYNFIKEDISNFEEMKKIFAQFNPDYVFNFAAESHVDRSIGNSSNFVRSNVEGTSVLLEHSRHFSIKRFIQISTDEVYGSVLSGDFSEDAPLNPSSPYAASKAAADLVALSHYKTHNVPVTITRSANNFGPFQFPEKLIPLFITNLIEGKKVPLMWSEDNPGLNKRDWVYVKDNCRAIWEISQKGSSGEIYNIPGENEKSNIEITRYLLNIFGRDDSSIEKIAHRKGHDFRYAINGQKLLDLGFKYEHLDFESNLGTLVDWHKKNKSWWQPLKK